MTKKRTCNRCGAFEVINTESKCILNFPIESKKQLIPETPFVKIFTFPLKPCPKPKTILEACKLSVEKNKEK